MINRLTNIKTQPAFAARLHVVDYSNFISTSKKGIEVTSTLSDRFVPECGKSGENLWTYGLRNCNSLAITAENSKNNLLLHLCSCSKCFFKNLSENMQQTADKINQTKKLILQEGKTPEGIIFGGDYSAYHSKELTAVLKFLVKAQNIEHSVISGAPGDKNIFCNGSKNEIQLNLGYFTKKDDFGNSFECIEFSPNDKIKFSDTEWMNAKEAKVETGELDLSIEDVLLTHNLHPDKVLNSLKI